MKPDPRFSGCREEFWANVRIVSQHLGYTERNEGKIKTYFLAEMVSVMTDLKLGKDHLVDPAGKPTSLAAKLIEYFDYRAKILNEQVEPRLMNKSQAKQEFARMKKALHPRCPIPMNKQKGAKRTPAYLTGMVNMTIEANQGGCGVDYDPRSLAVITKNGAPLRTLCRRIDGCFPSVIDPIAVWEIKEYYNTTTFGSRVADAIYETITDGMELKELREEEGVHIKHYLIVDDHYTWWECGRSYLCRIIDILNMGLLDEALFGREIFERLPQIVKEWVAQLERGR